MLELAVFLLWASFLAALAFMPLCWIKFVIIPFSHSEEEWEWLHEGFWLWAPRFESIALAIMIGVVVWFNRKGLVE